MARTGASAVGWTSVLRAMRLARAAHDRRSGFGEDGRIYNREQNGGL